MIRAASKYVLFPVLEWISGRHVSEQYAAFQAANRMPWAKRELENRKRLALTASYAKANVPYYRNLLEKIKFEPLRILDDPKYLQDIPILTKRDILEYGKELVSDTHRGWVSLQPSLTNGSTGRNLPVFYSPSAKDISAAATRITQDWIGFGREALQVHLSTRIPNHGDARSRRVERFRQLATGRISVEMASISTNELLPVWDSISRRCPYLVQGLPSQIYALAKAVSDDRGPQHGRVKVFVSTGETLFDHQRKLIENTFGCRVANRYGNAEFGIIAHEDFREQSTVAGEASGAPLMRVLDTHVWVEAYRSLGADISPVLVTTLNNRAFPLINYASGDLTKVIRDSSGIYLLPVQGRVHDTVAVGGVTYTTQFFQDLLSARCGVDDFQVVIDGAKTTIRVVPKSIVQNSLITEVLSSAFGPALEIEYCSYDQLERVGTQGKFRYVISREQSVA